jgi:hypothetical protein
VICSRVETGDDEPGEDEGEPGEEEEPRQ